MNINKNSKIFLLIRDYSLDSMGSLIVFLSAFPKAEYKFVHYSKIDFVIDDTKLKTFDFVFLIGLAPTFKDKLDKFPNSIVLANQDNYVYHRDLEKYRVVSINHSIITLSIKFLENYLKIKLTDFYDLENLIGDFNNKKWHNNKSLQLNWLFFYYDRNAFLNRFRIGKVEFNQEEIIVLNGIKNNFVETYRDVKEKLLILSNSICAIKTDNHLEEICWLILKENKYKYVFCFVPSKKKCYIRTNDDEIDLGEMVKQFPNSGGLRKSASFHIDSENDFVEKSILLVKLLESK